MAELKKIVRNTRLSNFRQVAPEAGGAFRVLAAAADAAYERLAPAAIAEQEAAGAELGRDMARRQIGDPASAPTDTLSLIKGFEGFRSSPYWDVNAHRAGYGSDTITDATGNVRKVTPTDFVSEADAERDLRRRVSTEFEPIAMRAVGSEKWASMTTGQRAALTSIAYNYGEIPDRIVGAVRGGSAADGAAAIRALAGDNGGINEKRRLSEASLFETAPEPVTLRNKDGKLESRLYSPMSGPILQAHNAAAGVAYNSEIMLKGVTDLMQMSEQFPLQPQAFMDAARGYVDGIVKEAPEPFRADLRNSLEKEANRRFLGMMEDQQRDTRQRAANSSSALVDRWSANYAEALASGNETEAENALVELNSLLAARETLPGIAWTREQSENIVLKAQDEAERIRQQARKDQETGWKSTLNTIIKAAKGGFSAADEDLLNDPAVQATHPELWREATAFTTLRDALPSFQASSPAERAAAIAELASLPVEDDFQIDLVNAAKAADKQVRDDFEADPILAAETYLPEKPPALPDFTAEDPQAFVEALAARHAYVLAKMESGHFPYKAFLSDDEAASLGAVMGKDVPPELRTLMSTAIVSGFGEDARSVFSEIKSDDPVTLYAGMLQARGGSPETSAAAMRGQAMIDEGLVQIPQKASRIEAVSPDIADALRFLPNDVKSQGELMKFATAIYAAGARGVDPSSDAASELMTSAMQAALGQSTNKRGVVTGGVQEIGGHNVFLPVGVSGEAVQSALEKAFTTPLSEFTVDREKGVVTIPLTGWEKAGAVPMLKGKPLSRRHFDNDEIRLIPVPSSTGMTYRMQIERGGGAVLDVEDANGNVFMFEMNALLEAAK